MSVADAFAALLRADPHAPVAWTPAGRRDRRDLHDLANSFELLLAAAPAGGRVGLSLKDGFAMLAAFLATARRGDAAILLDPGDPRAPRIDLAARLGAHGVVVDTPVVRLVHCAGDQPGAALPADDLRAIKLTSGSTAEPRAIGVGDAELIADAVALERSMGIGRGDRVLAAVPMSFSYGVGNLLVPALTAGRVLVLSADHALGLLQALRGGGEPTVLPAVPALLRALLRGGLRPPPSLRLVLCAGAMLPPEVARSCCRQLGLPVHAFYGSTETGGICYDRLGTAAERGSVGTPVDGVEVTLAEHGRVQVHSPAVGIALDGSRNPHDHRFLLPDLAEFRGDELVLHGRVGTVFDVGGHKVDPCEVERIIAGMARVTDVVVLPWRDVHGRAVCAAVVAARDVSGTDVRQHCARILPAAKVPRCIAVVPELPRSSRGKLLREDIERLLADDASAASRP